MPKINRDGVKIYYEVHGSGPPLLLTHGYSSTSAMWQGQIEALSKRHRLVLWDMRGHGRSDYPDDPGRRPRRQHRPATGVHRCRVAVSRWPRRQESSESHIMKKLLAAALSTVAVFGGAIAPVNAEALPPIGGPYPPPFTATLSNNIP